MRMDMLYVWTQIKGRVDGPSFTSCFCLSDNDSLFE